MSHFVLEIGTEEIPARFANYGKGIGGTFYSPFKRKPLGF